MKLWRKLTYLMPAVRRREDQDIQDELDALRRLAGPGELGNMTVAAEVARSTLGWPSLERLVQDIRYSLRAMAQRRAFTALVIMSLALGIGATTAIYSFIDAILLRSLPVQDPQALVVLKWRAKHYTLASGGMSWSTNGSSFNPTGILSSIFPYGALSVFQRSDDVLASAFGYFSNENQALTIGDGTETVKVHYVSGGYFTGMGVRPVAGRLLEPADDQPGAIVAMLSERMARSRFGYAGAAVGQTVWVDDQPVTVVGITPAAFFGAEPGSTPDVFLPLHAQVTISTGWTADVYRDDHFYWLEVMARLQPNVSVAQAQAVLATRFHAFVAGTATTEAQRKDLPNLVVEPGAGGLDSLRRQYAQSLYILLAMVALMLLIACANVANLLLARAASRGRELAIRLSLGATRARLICQLLTESVLLASVGGALGLVVAWWGIRALTAWLATGHTDLALNASLDLPVLAVTCGLSIFTGLLFGLAPAVRATRVDAAQALKAVRAGELRARRRGGAGQTLVVAQVALSFVLLIGAGLFGRTLANLHAIPLGFDRDDVLIFTLLPQQVGYRGPSLFSIFETVRDRLRSLPGAQGVSLSTGAPPTGGGTSFPVTILGSSLVAGPGANEKPHAVLAEVGPDFFRTLRMPVRGREFTALDSASAPKVVIVNHRLADLFGLASPIGRTLSTPIGDYTIVGEADDSVVFYLKEERRSIAYFPYLQDTRPPGGMVYELRTSGDPLALAPAVRDAVRQVDRRLAISDVQTETAHVDQEIGSQIALARLCSAFAGLALVLACVGVYGTVAFTVSRRTNELGIRMTLGAQRNTIVWMVVRGIIWLTLAGLGIGIPVVLVGSRFVGALLYGITPTDPKLLAVALAGLIACALIAGWIPARRAARIDPMMAIRQE